MITKNTQAGKIRLWILVGLPLVGIIGSTLLPLQPFVRQALIGIVLIWFQVSLMLGIFHP